MDLRNTLGAEYNVMLTGLTANLPFGRLLNTYGQPGTYQSELLDEYGAGKELVEFTPSLLKSDKRLAQPIKPSLVSYEMMYAFNDTDVPKVIKSIDPGYKFDGHKIKLNDLIWLTLVQRAGFLRQLLLRKDFDIDQQAKILNSACTFKDVNLKLQSVAPELLQYMPKEQPHFKTQFNDKTPLNKESDKFKRLTRIVAKADEYENGRGTRDLMRGMLAVDMGKDKTLAKFREARDYMVLCGITEMLGCKITRAKDKVSEHIDDIKQGMAKREETEYNPLTDPKDSFNSLPWPGVIINGKQSFELTDGTNRKPLIIKFEANEYMLIPDNKGIAQSKIDTAASRERARELEKHTADPNNDDRLLQKLGIQHIYTTYLPVMHQDILALPGDQAYEDTKAWIAQRAAGQKKKVYSGREVDFSSTNSLHDLVTGKETRPSLIAMVTPLAAQTRRPALII